MHCAALQSLMTSSAWPLQKSLNLNTQRSRSDRSILTEVRTLKTFIFSVFMKTSLLWRLCNCVLRGSSGGEGNRHSVQRGADLQARYDEHPAHHSLWQKLGQATGNRRNSHCKHLHCYWNNTLLEQNACLPGVHFLLSSEWTSCSNNHRRTAGTSVKAERHCLILAGEMIVHCSDTTPNGVKTSAMFWPTMRQQKKRKVNRDLSSYK